MEKSSFLVFLILIVILSACQRYTKRSDKLLKSNQIPIKNEDTSPDASEQTPTPSEQSPSNDDSIAVLHAGARLCIECHEKDRPAPPHIIKQDCATCHSYPSFRNVTPFTHLPKPTICEDCHSRPNNTGLRAYPNQGPPAGFDPNNPASQGSGHYIGKDCVACHHTAEEGATAFVFTHSSPVVEFCLPCHFNDGQNEHGNDNNVMLQDFGNCFNCHINFDRNINRNFDTNVD